MYKAFIVDDEKWVVASLKKGVRWQEYGFEFAGSASDGEEALQKIHELQPDLVITDIRMPEMDGMELIRRIRQACTNIQIVVISGYSEFEYARESIKFGVLGYCLKPIDEKEIEDCLQKAGVFLEKSQADLEFKILECMISFDSDKADYLAETLGKCGLRIGNGAAIAVIAVVGEGAPGFPSDRAVAAVAVGKGKKVYFVQHNKNTSLQSLLEKSLKPGKASMGIGGVVDNAMDIVAEVNKALMAAYGFFITGSTGVFLTEELDEKEAVRELSKLVIEAANGDIQTVDKAFDTIGRLLKTQYPSIKYAYLFYTLVSNMLLEIPEPNSEALFADYGLLADEYGSLDNMLVYLKRAVLDKINSQYDMGCHMKNDTVREILEYVHDNFFRDLSIQGIADRFYINPSYASRLFSREVGETFSKYLNRLRVKYACDLIAKTDLQIGEIASRAGYSDYFHFCKVFRKLTGKTPTQVREGL